MENSSLHFVRRLQSCLLAILIGLTLIIYNYGCKGDIAGPAPPGPNWVVFSKLNSPLRENIINSIYVDRGTIIWFATGDGAARFQNKSWSIFRDSLTYLTYDNGGNSYTVANVTSITRAKDQSIWFGLKGGGVARFNENSENGNFWRRYRQPIVSFDFVSGLASDISDASVFGEVWVITSLGVDRFVQNSSDGGVWTNLGALPILSAQNTVAAVNPYDYSIWIGSTGSGLEQVSYFPDLTLSRIPQPAGYEAKVNGIAFDAANNIWLATELGVSVLHLGSGTWTQYNHGNMPTRLPQGEVYAVESDALSHRWFGTDSGLISFKDSTWTRFSTTNSPLPDNTVRAIKYDIRGNLWIGTSNGIAVYNPEGTRL